MSKIYMLRESYLVREDDEQYAVTMVTSVFYMIKRHIKSCIENGRLIFDFNDIAFWKEHYKDECAFYEMRSKEISNELVQKYLNKEAKKDLWHKEPCTKEEYERMTNFKVVNSVDELFKICNEEEFISMINYGIRGATIDVVEDGKEICIKNTI